MSKKVAVPIIICIVLLVILLVLNFVLPNISLPGIQNPGEDESAAQERTKVNEVVLSEDGFNPISIRIKSGETVRFTNESGELASINSNPHPTHNLHKFLNLGELPTGMSSEVAFAEPGSYGYHNHLNPDQRGTIVVE